MVSGLRDQYKEYGVMGVILGIVFYICVALFAIALLVAPIAGIIYILQLYRTITQ